MPSNLALLCCLFLFVLLAQWSTLTPFYSEDILYSEADLAKETEDGVSVM
jgi:hypothetical protein